MNKCFRLIFYTMTHIFFIPNLNFLSQWILGWIALKRCLEELLKCVKLWEAVWKNWKHQEPGVTLLNRLACSPTRDSMVSGMACIHIFIVVTQILTGKHFCLITFHCRKTSAHFDWWISHLSLENWTHQYVWLEWE